MPDTINDSGNRAQGSALEKSRMTIPLQRRGSLGILETLAVEPGRCHFSIYQNIAIGVWVAQADRAAAEAALRVSQEMPKRCPNRHSSVAFLTDGLPGPMPEALPALTQLYARRSDLACTAIVIEGSGFWASGLRSMVNNTRREGGGDTPLKMGAAIGEVVDWLSEQHYKGTGVRIAPADLQQALAFARQLGEQARGG
jgi:hypothetical protein